MKLMGIYILIVIIAVRLYSIITLIQLGGWANMLAAIISVLAFVIEFAVIFEALISDVKKGEKNERIHD